MACGLGRRFGAPKATSSAAPTRLPAATAKSNSASPVVPAMSIVARRRSSAAIGDSPPLARQPGLADHRGSRGTGEVCRRTGSASTPATTSRRARREPSPSIPIAAIEKEVGGGSGSRGEYHQPGRRHRRRHRMATATTRGTPRLSAGQCRGRALWPPAGRVAAASPRSSPNAVVRALGDLDEQDQQHGRRAPEDHPDDVSGMAVVALARGSGVEADRLRAHDISGVELRGCDSCRSVPCDCGDDPQDQHGSDEHAAIAEHVEQARLAGDLQALRRRRRAATTRGSGTKRRRRRAATGSPTCGRSADCPRRRCCGCGAHPGRST